VTSGTNRSSRYVCLLEYPDYGNVQSHDSPSHTDTLHEEFLLNYDVILAGTSKHNKSLFPGAVRAQWTVTFNCKKIRNTRISTNNNIVDS
jgi:hypothetical protein